jgi:hypothetical protein
MKNYLNHSPMKKISLAVAMLAIMVLTSCGTASKAVRSEADQATAEVVTTMLQKGVYKMDFNRGYSSSGPSFPLNYPYYVSVIKGRVESFLPYIGRAYNVPYGGGEGLNFTAPISDYKMTQDKKGRWIVTFDARTTEDRYWFRVEIYPAGDVYLSVNATQKQSMSFSGNVDLDPEFELIKVDK